MRRLTFCARLFLVITFLLWRASRWQGILTSALLQVLTGAFSRTPQFYCILRHRFEVKACASVQEAQEQLTGLKFCARSLAQARRYWPFLTGTPTARDKARLAMKVWRAWLAGDAKALASGCEVWPELAGHFVDGRLVDEGTMQVWVAELAAEELERIRRGPQPDTAKAQRKRERGGEPQSGG